MRWALSIVVRVGFAAASLTVACRLGHARLHKALKLTCVLGIRPDLPDVHVSSILLVHGIARQYLLLALLLPATRLVTHPLTTCTPILLSCPLSLSSRPFLRIVPRPTYASCDAH